MRKRTEFVWIFSALTIVIGGWVAPTASFTPPSITINKGRIRIACKGNCKWRSSCRYSTPEGNNSNQPPPNNSKKKSKTLTTCGRTLYEVLQCPPTATKSELKKAYVSLARQTHPDATIGLSEDEASKRNEQFSEIAAAWRILSDKQERLRYDRALQAEAFTGDVERLAADFLDKKAAPAVNRIFEKVAMPIFRRAAATTIASASAVVDSSKQKDIGDAFKSALRAGQNAAKAIDRIELLEKSQELEKRAKTDLDRANRIRADLSTVIDRRLNLSVFVPNSAISSDEAMHILDGLNTLDKVSVVDRMMLKNTVQYEIEALEELEENYYTKADERNMADIEYKDKLEALQQAEVNAQAAMEAEKRAREALEAAERLVANSRQDLAECSKALTQVDTWRKRTVTETERVHQQLDRKREMVRKALLRKEEEYIQPSATNLSSSGSTTIDNDVFTSTSTSTTNNLSESFSIMANDVQQMGDTAINEVIKLRKEETFLSTECQRLEERASRLRSRARKLRLRSEGIRSAMKKSGDGLSEEEEDVKLLEEDDEFGGQEERRGGALL
mmetsp:Transcript_31867/g.46894  ORF Transcript_31867/g.46894 Transcript_31867/m.46894 type:complete len:560 (+) Transcript_31867:86-1765(+)